MFFRTPVALSALLAINGVVASIIPRAENAQSSESKANNVQNSEHYGWYGPDGPWDGGWDGPWDSPWDGPWDGPGYGANSDEEFYHHSSSNYGKRALDKVTASDHAPHGYQHKRGANNKVYNGNHEHHHKREENVAEHGPWSHGQEYRGHQQKSGVDMGVHHHRREAGKGSIGLNQKRAEALDEHRYWGPHRGGYWGGDLDDHSSHHEKHEYDEEDDEDSHHHNYYKRSAACAAKKGKGKPGKKEKKEKEK